MRSKLCITIVLMMLWYSVAGAYQVMHASMSKGFDIDHLDMHAHAVLHHHDDDGHVHQDQSEQSATHMALDGVIATVAMAVPSQVFISQKIPALIDQEADSLPESLLVYLLFRPPRSLA